jgi:hypothetical protein
MKRFFPIFLALGIVVGAAGWAQVSSPPAPIPSPALAISGDTVIPFWGMCALELVGAQPTSTVWVVMPDPVTEDDTTSKIHFTAKPGRYNVLTFCVVSGGAQYFKTPVEFLPEPVPPGPVPPPGPLPPPPPNPTPVPTGNVWAIAIFDTSQQASLPAGQLAIYGSPTIGAAVKAIGAIWRRYDVADKIPKNGSSIVVTDTNWGHAAAAVGWPALVFTDSSGVIVHPAQKLPLDEASVVAAVRLALGK